MALTNEEKINFKNKIKGYNDEYLISEITKKGDQYPPEFFAIFKKELEDRGNNVEKILNDYKYSDKKDEEQKTEWGSLVAAVIGMFLVECLSIKYNNPNLLLEISILIIILFLAYIAGYWFSKWYSKKEKLNSKFKNFIIWSNLITWFFPFLGIFTGTVSYSFGTKEQNKKYKILGILGIIGAILSAIFNIYFYR